MPKGSTKITKASTTECLSQLNFCSEIDYDICYTVRLMFYL